MATIPIGTFRKKTDSQPRCSTIRPTVGPRASARPDIPAHRPIALARSWGGKVTVMIDSVPGISRAAPTPWNARARSCVVLWDRPQSAGEREDREAGEEDLLAPVAVARDAAR